MQDRSDGGSRTAPAPFDKPSADLILRSSNRIDFHVFRWIMADASHMFAAMLELPQALENGNPLSTPPSSVSSRSKGATPSPSPSPPVIDVTESSGTLEALLRMCYPLSVVPELASFDDMKPIVEAAHKYQVEHALRLLTPQLLGFADADPLRVYIFAVKYDMSTLAEEAARRFLRVKDALVYTSELADIDAVAYHRLLAYRSRCSASLLALKSVHPCIVFPATGVVATGRWTWAQCACVKHTCSPRRSGCNGCVADWFKAFYDALMGVLEATPCTEELEVASLRLADTAVENASQCTTCGRVAASQVRSFLELFKKEVQRRLLEVTLYAKRD